MPQHARVRGTLPGTRATKVRRETRGQAVPTHRGQGTEIRGPLLCSTATGAAG